MTKLHVGCANTKFDGFLNVDVRKTSATDLVCPAWDIKGVQCGTVELIYSRHMLEHLDPNDARKTLSHWRNLLSYDGWVNIIVPDIEFHAKQLLGLSISNERKFPDQQQHAFNSIWGWRDESRGGSREDAHKWGYTQESLFLELERAGFQAGERITRGKDSEPWHLNVVAALSKGALESVLKRVVQ